MQNGFISPNLIILFGSQTKGTATLASDFDIGVVAKEPLTFKKYMSKEIIEKKAEQMHSFILELADWTSVEFSTFDKTITLIRSSERKLEGSYAIVG